MSDRQTNTSRNPGLSPGDLLLGGLSAAMLLVSFPKLNFFPLAWFALIPLLSALRGKKTASAFLFGWISGTLFFLPLLLWLMPVFRPMGLLGLLPWFLIAIFQGGFWGLWMLSVAWVEKIRKFQSPWIRIFFPAAAWVALEWIRSLGPLGFLWGGLGYSQYKFIPLIQISCFTGFYGISFLIVLFNASLLLLLENLRNKENRKFPHAVAVSFIIVIAVVCFGFLRMAAFSFGKAGRPLRAAVIQVNIDQDVKWDRRYFEQTMGLLEEMTLSAARGKPDLIIWPETAVPSYLLSDPALLLRVKMLAGKAGAAILTGSLEAEYGKNYNSVIFLTPVNGVEAAYRKIHLVPFAEYLPFEKSLRRYSVFDRISNFSSGRNLAVFTLGTLNFSPLVCFESIFPQPARNCVRNGAEALVVLTNDAWFEKTSAAEHHLAMSAFRAVENGVFLVQGANTGISALVDPCGRIIRKSPLFERLILEAEFQPRQKNFFSIYTHVGDLFAILCLMLVLAVFISGRLQTSGK